MIRLVQAAEELPSQAERASLRRARLPSAPRLVALLPVLRGLLHRAAGPRRPGRWLLDCRSFRPALEVVNDPRGLAAGQPAAVVATRPNVDPHQGRPPGAWPGRADCPQTQSPASIAMGPRYRFRFSKPGRWRPFGGR